MTPATASKTLLGQFVEEDTHKPLFNGIGRYTMTELLHNWYINTGFSPATPIAKLKENPNLYKLLHLRGGSLQKTTNITEHNRAASFGNQDHNEHAAEH